MTADLAVASMVGLPPLIDYVAKDAALVQLLELTSLADLVTLVAIAVSDEEVKRRLAARGRRSED